MSLNSRATFFDGIAEKWDGWEDLVALSRKLAAGLDYLGVGADEKILDVGCGTGNLTQALLDRLSPAGRIFALDCSPRMIEVARCKIRDQRVSWHLEDARQLTFADRFCDRVICYSVWPHFENPKEVAAELTRVLKPGGSFNVWHMISRQKVNEIHARAGEAVSRDILPPANETANLLMAVGLQVISASESDDGYLVTAVKPE